MLADAALALLARDGVSAVTTRAVADESGWSTGVLNHYFDSRHDLLLAALRRAGDIQGEQYRSILDAADVPALDKLHNITASVLPLDKRRLAMTRIYLFFYAEGAAEEAARTEIAGFLARWRSVVRDTVVAAQEQGSIPADLDPDSVTMQLVALTDGLAMQSILDQAAMKAIRAKGAIPRFVDIAVQRAVVRTG